MIVKYREIIEIGDYKAIEIIREKRFLCSWKPKGTSLRYFRTDRYNLFTVSENDIIEIRKEFV